MMSRLRGAGVTLVVGLAVACPPEVTPVGSLDFRPGQLVLQRGTYTKAQFVWQAEAPLYPAEARPIVFVHLIDAAGLVVRTFDHPLPGNWRAGETIEYEQRIYHSTFGFAVPPGDYRLTAGLYDGGGRRWALRTSGRHLGRNAYELAEVVVPEPHPSPRFEFSPAWEPVEAGTDRQILGRRWLRGAGSITVRNLHEPGALWLALDAVVPVRIAASCMAGEPMSAQGPTDIEIPVDAGGRTAGALKVALQHPARSVGADDANGCEIQIRPQAGSPDAAEPSVRLDVAAFAPASTAGCR